MRGLVVGYVRDRKALKRGGELSSMPLGDWDVGRGDGAVDVERLAEALDELATVDAALAELVDLRRAYGPAHLDIAVALNNLGALCQTRGRLTAALRYYRSALAMKRRLLGASHVDFGVTLNNLATLETRRGHPQKARPAYEEALAIFRKTLSLRHPTLVRCQENARALERAAEKTRH